MSPWSPSTEQAEPADPVISSNCGAMASRARAIRSSVEQVGSGSIRTSPHIAPWHIAGSHPGRVGRDGGAARWEAMGRASRVRAAGRAERTANGGLLFREPRPADEAASVELLGRVEFTRPETGAEMAHAVAHRHRLDPSCGVQATWVAESRQGEVVGVLTAAPPLGWIGSVKTLSPEHRSYVAQHIVDAEALSVAPEARGRSGAPGDQDGGRALHRSRVPADAGDVSLQDVSRIQHGGDGLDLDELVLVTEHGDAHQRAGDVMVSERVPDNLPGGHKSGLHVRDGFRRLARVVPDRCCGAVIVQRTRPRKEDQAASPRRGTARTWPAPWQSSPSSALSASYSWPPP